MKQILFIFLLILVFQSSKAQKWDETYGTTYYDEGFTDVVECYDKGYLISGGKGIPLPCEWLIKTDINGTQLWDKTIYHNEYSMNSGPIEQNSSGEIAIVGTIFFDNENWPYIIKLDACGNKLWCKVYVEDESEWGVFWDAIILENGDVVALAYMSNQYYYPDNIFLYYIDSNGNLLWRESYASKDEYPDILLPKGKKLYKINNGYMIAGQCYYPSPQGYMRPLFIRLDNDFKEIWILPFGVSSSLIAYGINVFPMNDSTFMGIGTTGDETRLMFFNDEGVELGYNDISNESIGPNIEQNVTDDIAKLNDSLYITSTVFDDENYGNPFGELVIDTAGNVYKSVTRPNTEGVSILIKTTSNKYVKGCTYRHPNNNKDIYLCKINDSLEHDTINTGNYVYDSLCPYQIESGIIDITDCMLITDVRETPTPEEHFASLKIFSIKAYPNPANEGVVTFEFVNLEYLSSSPRPEGVTHPTLQIFNVFGQQVHKEKIYPYQGESKVDVSKWSDGMYIGIVVSEGKPISRCKFVVQ